MSYDAIRAAVKETGSDSRVEVNQRALIDKILARYASAGAVYRELLQNSNDAEATIAEVHFSVQENIVKQVLYRNNGMPFRPQDWHRLQKIAEGNPDVSKVGAFGVGAYTMFSICEEPLVISGNSSLCFVWKGDALWCKTAPLAPAKAAKNDQKWTSFVLPSRDPYPLPDLVEFGEFLCASLTFTQCLRHVRVVVNDQERLSITKTIVQEPRLVATPKSSSWFSNQGAAVTTTPNGTFTLENSTNSIALLKSAAISDKQSSSSSSSIYESIHRMTVQMDGAASSMDARYVSATATTKIGSEMARRMERVTKKQPPKQVQLQLFLNATRHTERPRNSAERITQSFSPKPGAGRIFIGFRTSQTTGLAAHVSAPFIPTVEREAMDLQDPTLRIFNLELLELAGILLRLTLEHSMYSQVDVAWKEHAAERQALEERLHQQEEARRKNKKGDEEVAAAAQAVESPDEAEDEVDLQRSSSSTFMGFARFMARGVKKKIVSVVTTVEKLMDDGSDLLNPSDPRRLSAEEEDAIVLMQSFCPVQSTPDPLVGTALAQGFSRCLPQKAPPVLTRTGVVRGDEARLPNYGIEQFVKDDVVRSVVYKNCEEYHSVIAGCRKVTLYDLARTIDNKPLEEEEMVNLIKWLTKFKRIDPHGVSTLGPAFKQAIKYYPAAAKTNAETGQRDTVALTGVLFFVEKDSILASPTLPMPDTVLRQSLQDKIGLSTLADPTLRNWFSALPVEIWADYISHHTSLTDGKPGDQPLRIEILAILSKEYSRRSMRERDVFGSFCSSILADRRCVPSERNQAQCERPSDLYVRSAELKAFEGIGSFHKVSSVLDAVGITEPFLLCLGVRKSVAIDFLFANLQSLKWSVDPKPLVEYLRTATLSREDMGKLTSTQYFPEEKDESRLFAPSELYLPNMELRSFPFIRMLRWPSEPEISERSDNGKFLQKIGMKSMPPLTQVLEYLSTAEINVATRIKCFDFLCERLGPHGLYHAEYSRFSYSQRGKFRFIPCTVNHPFDHETQSSDLRSSVTCFSEESCGIMGFPVLDSKLGENTKMYGSLLQCAPEPEASFLIHKLIQLVSSAKTMQKKSADATHHIVVTFAAIYKYLSHRAPEIDEAALRKLQQESFIPCVVDGGLSWFRSDQVFFRSTNGNIDKITEELFPAVEFSPFLAATGVRQEASTKDMFQLMLASPQDLLKTLGDEKKYRSLLRRIAANPPFRRVTPEIRDSPFLLAYTVKATQNGTTESPDTATYHLAKAADIYIIDNSFFGRMFSVDRAPHESDLEDFYVMLGSQYISKSVDRRFEVVGKPDGNSELTRNLKQRLHERSPLLVSPNITTRPLVNDAASVVDEKNLTFYQASNLMAVYSLAGKTRRNRTTCFSRRVKGNQNAIFVVEDFDWFDVGYAIGDLILARCQLEDAFFISSLLEAPLEQLSARGFPVDRILRPEPKVIPVEQPVPPPPSTPAPSAPETIQASVPQTAATVQNPHIGVPSASTAAVAASASASAPPKVQQKAPVDDPKMSGVPSGGMEEILMQMFPDADKDFVKSALGENPSLADVQSLAEQMAAGEYLKTKDTASDAGTNTTAASDSSPPPSTQKSRFGKRLSKALGGIRGNSHKMPSSGSSMWVPPVHGTKPPVHSTAHETRNPVSPALDAQSQTGLERMLEQTVRGSSLVSQNGINSGSTTVTSALPEGLDRGDTCDIMEGHSLQPYLGYRGDGKTINGIRVFFTRFVSTSAPFLSHNEDATEQFGLVLERLAEVYDLPLSSIAIFHDPTGGTIAFNSNKSLHFNVRFFHSLHYLPGKQHTAECYAYWYITTAHELAHHLVSAHNKEHGFYTESYASHYLPKLLALLGTL